MKQILALAAVLGLAAAAVAAPSEGSEPKGRTRLGRRSMLKEDVGLSDDQVSQLERLHRETARALVRKQADLRIARMELRDLLAAATVDDKAVDAKVKQLGALHEATVRARVEGRIAVRKVLTAEQYQRLDELSREHRRARRPGRQGERRRDRRSRPDASVDEGDDDAGAVR